LTRAEPVSVGVEAARSQPTVIAATATIFHTG
jgi:hypothetical protein